MEERAGDRVREGRHEQRFETYLERLRNDAQVVEAEIHCEGETHQIEFAHVFVLVLKERFKPGAMAQGKIPVVTLDPFLDRFAAPLRRDQLRRAGGGE